MKKLNHPNIINMLEVIDDPNHEKIYMVMDYAESGPIAHWHSNHSYFTLSNKLVIIIHYSIGSYTSWLFIVT